MRNSAPTSRFPFWLWLIRLIGVIVPRRLRADWRQEWEAELSHREALLADWDRLNWRCRLNLVWRSTSAFWDAIWLQTYRWEDAMIQDLRFGVRMLIKNLGFTVIAVTTFALGIGVNTMVFSGAYLLLFAALPYPNADRLVVISQTSQPEVEFGVSYPDFTVWREKNTSFEQMAASRTINANLTSSDPVMRVSGCFVSAEFFSLLGGRAEFGRTFVAEEFHPGNENVIILSHSLWQNRFDSDAGVIGRTLRLDSQVYTIVGVMPPSFSYPLRSVFWTPLEAGEQARILQDPTINDFDIVAMVKQGVNIDRAAQELRGLSQSAALPRSLRQPESNIKLSLLQDTLPGLTKYRTPLLTLQFAVLFVLLIGSLNLANLLLARNAVRRQEFTIRLAIGASRWRLVRQLLIESLLLGMLGSVLGLLLAAWGINLLRAVSDLQLPGVGVITINLPVLLITLLVSLLTTLAFGLGPALSAARPSLIDYLKTGVGGADPRQRRLSGILIAAEVALAVALLIGSGLMIRTFLNVIKQDPGFKTENAIAVSLSLPAVGRPDYESLAAYFNEAFRRIRALPGVESVGGVTYMPLVGYNPGVNFTFDGSDPTPETAPRADIQPITPDYFEAIGIPIQKGRKFTEAEMTSQPTSAIINNAFAKKFWPDDEPLGKQLKLQSDRFPRAPLTVVGVVADVNQFGVRIAPRPEIYLPQHRHTMTLIVRSAGNRNHLFADLRDTVQRLDEQAAISMKTIEQLISRSNWAPRNMAIQLGVLAAVALLLAAMGIYGVISYIVTQRTHEMGIRLALGARKRDILKLVLGQGLTLTLTGFAAGLALSLVLTRFLSSLLFGVSAIDPGTFVVIAVLLVVVALAASYLPARRATRVDPIGALRHE